MLDKPLGMTSNAALQAARRLFNAQKAGHTGTLDPLATGLLPLCFGEATKFAGELLHADKSYRATLRLGVTTDTADAEGKILRTRPVAVDQSIWRTTAADFCGEIEQVPPMHSALKRDGKPLYEYARAGVDVPREPRRVRIYRLELISLAGDEAVIDVDCSKGTYVRTLAADIGEALGCGAHLAALRRTRIGGFDVTGAVTLAELDSLTVDARDERLHPTDALLSHLPVAKLAATDTERVLHGRAVPWQGETGRFRLYGANDQFLGLGDRSADGLLNPRRMIVSGEDR